MKMIRKDLNATTPASDMMAMLAKATQEGKAVAADLCSTRLDKLATYAANEGLSAAEIVELIREEAAAITSKGGAAWQ
ncbi:DUF2732 family protein [Cronobacter sakazakii]|uniref:DUF2732 family protein n=1 Tax=Cronobacter sakazakii TaxID=28141 RepID=UPI00135EB89C|nr:DUF2732 family protein [Cronobacter sakazakii]EIX1655726.1 DUF2732 family protein [Cronobacter sakazakii]EIX1763583.1 DUF2732 family protein [Cronobacter sakazakii]EIX6121372.1 DUF2732 family protein [Cronobacter sakazakii]EIX6210875.1 DUF2732 family protein [Cronobacter sakazakii]EJP5808351.1 DUF2732 family protein [Cronobacter sakazakii]